MVGMEIDMIVTDSLKALELYESIFEKIERIEVTDFPKGQNEAVFSMYGTRIHLLDENPEFGMVAPKPGDPKPIWFNVLVPNIKETFAKALKAECTEVQPITEMPEFGISNALFSDSFGYLWMLHQVHKEVSFEDRMRLMEDRMHKG